MANFQKALAFTLINEGGYSDVPEDSGGPTNFGITQDDLSRWLGHPVSPEDVKQMSLQTATEIYFKWYWTPLGLSLLLNDNVATCIFDTGVNRGIGMGARYAQTVANQMGAALAVDGQIGPLSEDAINAVSSNGFIQNYFYMVKSGYESIVENNPSQQIFYNGWMSRASRLLTLITPLGDPSNVS